MSLFGFAVRHTGESRYPGFFILLNRSWIPAGVYPDENRDRNDAPKTVNLRPILAPQEGFAQAIGEEKGKLGVGKQRSPVDTSLFFSLSLDLSGRIDENGMITRKRVNRGSHMDAVTA